MLCQNYESVVIPYRTQDEMGPGGFGGAYYHSDIPDPWGERLARITGMWVRDGLVYLMIWTNQHNWPSWNRFAIIWNAQTGAFVSRSPGVFARNFDWNSYGGSYWYSYEIRQGPYNDLWAGYITGHIYQLDDNFQPIADSYVDPARFDAIGLSVFFFDTVRNRAVVRRGNDSSRHLQVREFQSGALLRELDLPASIVDMCWADTTKLYILLANKAVVCWDYEENKVFEYVRIPQLGDLSGSSPGTAGARIAWHQTYRRLLICQQTTDNADGTSTTKVKGYRNQPVATHLCRPIPLKRRRAGLETPVLIKQIGDVSEGIAGLVTAATSGAAATAPRGVVTLDGTGEGVLKLLGTAEGTETLSLSAEVACLP